MELTNRIVRMLIQFFYGNRHTIIYLIIMFQTISSLAVTTYLSCTEDSIPDQSQPEGIILTDGRTIKGRTGNDTRKIILKNTRMGSDYGLIITVFLMSIILGVFLTYSIYHIFNDRSSAILFAIFTGLVYLLTAGAMLQFATDSGDSLEDGHMVYMGSRWSYNYVVSMFWLVTTLNTLMLSIFTTSRLANIRR